MINDVGEIKNVITNLGLEIDEVRNFLEGDYYRRIVREMFQSLFILLKDYEKNRKRIEEVFDILDEMMETASGKELNYYKASIYEIKSKINFRYKRQQQKKLKEVIFRIDNMQVMVEELLTLKKEFNYKESLEFFIFQEKNLWLVKQMLEEYPLSREDGYDLKELFSKVLKLYLSLNELDEEEIQFFYQVIFSILDSSYGEEIRRDKEHYLQMICNSDYGYKRHIIMVIDLLDPTFMISLEELEEKYQVHFDFPEIVLEGMKEIGFDKKMRVDFTNQECVTIDGKGDKCLDDAMYIEKSPLGFYNLYIHITDVSGVIPYNSILNEEARMRVETLYLRDRNILMYPDEVCNDLCSLLPGKRRKVVTYIFRLDDDFNLLEDKFKVVPGVIESKHQLSYGEVDEVLANLNLEVKYQQVLFDLAKFAERRRRQTKKKEKYRQVENFLNFEVHHESLKLDYSVAANIVHEAMVLVNYSIAKYFKEHGFPYIYRKYQMENREVIESIFKRMQSFNPELKRDKEFLQKLQMSYVSSSYCSKPSYHQGLDMECYSHSTSPARRYADSLGQYLIADIVFGGNNEDYNLNCWQYRIDYLVRYLNKKKKDNEVFSEQYNYLSYKKLIKK